MPDQQTPPGLSHLKSPMQSKKFVAFLISEVTWKVIIFVITYMGMKNGTVGMMTGSLILACVLIAGFVESGYIIGQGSLDKYLGLAQIATQNGHSIKLKDAEILKHDTDEPTDEPAPAEDDSDG